MSVAGTAAPSLYCLTPEGHCIRLICADGRQDLAVGSGELPEIARVDRLQEEEKIISGTGEVDLLITKHFHNVKTHIPMLFWGSIAVPDGFSIKDLLGVRHNITPAKACSSPDLLMKCIYGSPSDRYVGDSQHEIGSELIEVIHDIETTPKMWSEDNGVSWKEAVGIVGGKATEIRQQSNLVLHYSMQAEAMRAHEEKWRLKPPAATQRDNLSDGESATEEAIIEGIK